MRSGLATFIDLWVNTLTCGCVQLVSMETPGYGVYVDKFFLRRNLSSARRGESALWVAENGMGMWHSGNCGGL